MVAASLIALALVATTSFNHYYTAFAVKDKTGSNTSTKGTSGGGSSGFTIPGSSSPSSSTTTTAPNPNTLTKKELSSFISCINTANKSEGLTHKVVTTCLDTAKGITPAASSSTTTGSSSGASSSLAPSATSKS